MARWAGEMEFDFVEGAAEGGNFVTTGKVVVFIRNHLAKGEVEPAARLYEQAGTGIQQELLTEARSASLNSQKFLADMFVMARDFATAAQVYEMAKRLSDAAKMYEQAGDYGAAARCFQKDGDVLRAAQALERAGQGGQALQLYERAGAHEVLAECLARQARYFEAAQLYQRLGNIRGEVEMLRLVAVADPGRIAAVKRLAVLLEQYGHGQQATQLLIETFKALPAAQSDAHLVGQLVRLLEIMGRGDQAQKLRGHLAQLTGQAAPAQIAAPQGSVEIIPPSAQSTGMPQGPGVQVVPADPFDTIQDPFGDGKTAPQQPTASPAADAYSFLKSIPIFGELSIGDMKDLYRLCQDVNFMPGTTIIEQAVRGQGLVIILDGNVQVVLVDAAGATKPLASLGPGKYVGEISLVDDAPTSARVMAQSMVRALFLPRERFEHFLYSRADAALRIYRLFTRTLAERLRIANQRK